MNVHMLYKIEFSGNYQRTDHTFKLVIVQLPMAPQVNFILFLVSAKVAAEDGPPGFWLCHLS